MSLYSTIKAYRSSNDECSGNANQVMEFLPIDDGGDNNNVPCSNNKSNNKAWRAPFQMLQHFTAALRAVT